MNIMTNKLELTWVDKYKMHEIEPRILIEDNEKSYGDKNNGNMLIHGDNLLALKALEKNFNGKIKCIYISIRHIILEMLLNIMMIILNIVYG